MAYFTEFEYTFQIEIYSFKIIGLKPKNMQIILIITDNNFVI